MALSQTPAAIRKRKERARTKQEAEEKARQEAQEKEKKERKRLRDRDIKRAKRAQEKSQQPMNDGLFTPARPVSTSEDPLPPIHTCEGGQNAPLAINNVDPVNQMMTAEVLSALDPEDRFDVMMAHQLAVSTTNMHNEAAYQIRCNTMEGNNKISENQENYQEFISNQMQDVRMKREQRLRLKAATSSAHGQPPLAIGGSASLFGSNNNENHGRMPVGSLTSNTKNTSMWDKASIGAEYGHGAAPPKPKVPRRTPGRKGYNQLLRSNQTIPCKKIDTGALKRAKLLGLRRTGKGTNIV